MGADAYRLCLNRHGYPSRDGIQPPRAGSSSRSRAAYDALLPAESDIAHLRAEYRAEGASRIMRRLGDAKASRAYCSMKMSW